MGLATICVTVLFASMVICRGKTDHLPGAVPKERAVDDPPKPSISNTFQVEVEGFLKSSMVGVDGTVYFDRPNNIAAIEMLWQNDFLKTIYSFATNERIVIRGYDCDVVKISNNTSESFFPFTADLDSGRKMVGSPEQALYFANSEYVGNVYDGAIETYMYRGYTDVPMYKKENCTVIHHFSMPNFATSHCDSRFCEPVLVSVSVECAGEEKVIEGEKQLVGQVDHLYRFFNFAESISDETVFHPPPGVYCNRENTKNFPYLPMYFSFTYDVTEKAVQDDTGGLKILHKKVWYDGDLQIIRVDGFYDNGFQQDSRIYDFYNGMAYSAYLQLNVTSRRALDNSLSLQVISLLPPEVFPRPIHKPRSSPVFVGLRTLHGLQYHVWSVVTEGLEYNPRARVVTELYFQTSVSERDGEIVKEAGQQISFAEVYTYIADESDDTKQLSEVTFVPINNFRSAPRDFSAFDVSTWFDKDEKRGFQIDVVGPAMIVGTKSYGDFLEQLYLEIVTLGSFSVTRIGKLEISSSDPTTNTTTFSGWILESLSKLGYNTSHSEADLNTTFSELERLTREGKLGEITVADENGKTQTFVLSSFRRGRTEDKGKNGKGSTSTGYRTYSGGAMAATALTMLVVGLVTGLFVMVAPWKKCTAKRTNSNLIENS